MVWIFFILAAAIGAVSVGLIGTGSSLIILPTLAAAFPTLFAEEVALRMATGTTLAVMSVGALSASVAQARNGQVCWPLVGLSALPYLIGAGFLGPRIAATLDVEILRYYIAGMLALIGVMTLRRRGAVQNGTRDWKSHRIEISLVLIIIGMTSSTAGIASGVFAMPYLSRFNLTFRTIIGTSTVGATLYCIFGALGYVASGWGKEAVPAWSAGYVYLPALVVMGITGALFSPLGVRLAGRFNERALRTMLGCFVLIAAAALALR